MKDTLWFDVFSLSESSNRVAYQFAFTQKQFGAKFLENRDLARRQGHVDSFALHHRNASCANRPTNAAFVGINPEIAQSRNSGRIYAH